MQKFSWDDFEDLIEADEHAPGAPTTVVDTLDTNKYKISTATEKKLTTSIPHYDTEQNTKDLEQLLLKLRNMASLEEYYLRGSLSEADYPTLLTCESTARAHLDSCTTLINNGVRANWANHSGQGIFFLALSACVTAKHSRNIISPMVKQIMCQLTDIWKEQVKKTHYTTANKKPASCPANNSGFSVNLDLKHYFFRPEVHRELEKKGLHIPGKYSDDVWDPRSNGLDYPFRKSLRYFTVVETFNATEDNPWELELRVHGFRNITDEICDMIKHMSVRMP